MVSMPTASRTLPVRAHNIPQARRLASRATAAAALALLAAAALTACTSTSAKPSPTTAGSAPAAATPTGTSTSKAGATNLDSSPLHVSCATLAPSAVMQATYSGMVADSTPVVPANTDAAVIAADKGTACTWKDSSSGATLTLAVGKYSANSVTRLENALVTASQPVPTFSGEGYFSLSGKTGTAEAFTGDYWVVAISDSPVFFEPGGAEPIVDAALAALKARG
ncbi:hypothetical protein AX769_14755 [Frondihabitans sp. PAMC 28766]|nr:hypothetical protein AX769_14755 [Frondihabitans sp. PAMC 28766]